MHLISVVQAFCGLSFLGYGISCLGSSHMVAEFQRYRIPQYRALTGSLQILATVGLLLGVWMPWLGGLAAAGLSLQMACGIVLRIHIGDTWFKCLPAASYLLLCGWLATQLLAPQ
ncbi:MAG: DoxX family protein [Coraliomargarita sp.]